VMVREPAVDETVAILRGLKEKYEVHHGVRIVDSALISAAKLSNRYISGRFLPDKAIDLIDEAASRLRMEMDSVPIELAEIQEKITQLEIEKRALDKEKGKKEVEGVDGFIQQVTPSCRCQRLSPQIHRYCSILGVLNRRRRDGSSPCSDRLLH